MNSIVINFTIEIFSEILLKNGIETDRYNIKKLYFDIEY